MVKAKKECVENDVQNNSVCKRQRIVDLCELGRNLKCKKCKNVFDLENIVAEKHVGLHSVLSIVCRECDVTNAVHTGKINKSGNGEQYAESNVTAVLGSIHSGVGHTALQKILACMDIPCLSNEAYKRYEIFSAWLLRKLQRIAASELLQKKDTLGNIVNIIISYDMGWSKRGNGRSYDSLNGYATIIGFLSKKILDFTTCNRKCSKCDKGHNKNEHDCRLNFQGSAKAMEAYAGVELITKSEVLKEVGLNVRAVIGDEDISIIAAVRTVSDKFIHKLADKNHLVKHFTNEWYGLAKKFNQLNKKGAISHLKKCFTYAIAQDKGQETQLGDVLRNLPDHLYGRHENCSEWCHRQNSLKQSIKFTDEALYDGMTKVFTKYANNAAKFAMAASSQTNESVNNIIAHKAPKNVCLSKSASCDFRVASEVCSKNDGEQSINSIRKKLNISYGDHVYYHAIQADKKWKDRACRESTKPKKLRRLQLKENCTIVYFDLETSGFSAAADILQIAAISGEVTFNVYIHSSQKVPANVRDLKYSKVNLAHNASFDTPRLLRLISKYNMIDEYRVITGFSNTLIVFKKVLSNRKGPGLFKLKTLYDDFIRNENDTGSDSSFHDAQFDVEVLQKLAIHFKIEEKLFSTLKTFQTSLIELNDSSEIRSDYLINVYKKEGESKIVEILSEKVDGKPRVSKNKKVLQKIIKNPATF
ncbi:uncharacterized protein LOC124411343 [Diprion similis]|uniref:uncharacterized protein LOC124411343 n=1 Tax=Diprion similis TaxID=362088 RepID=UPI001EF7C4A8|nr:uncharacterized protein LOC124411343 [Diprion similis]